ncbi:FAD-dependent oxidoreductase, partial [Faecalibacterium hattorii]
MSTRELEWEENRMANVLIVGGGAAGLMAAGAAVRQGHKVTVLEHMD